MMKLTPRQVQVLRWIDALTRAGGGEYTINQAEAMHRDEQFKLWQERRR